MLTKKKRAGAQDLILTHLKMEGGSDHTFDMRKRLSLDEIVLLCLCEELHDLGLVALQQANSIDEPLDHYWVTITSRGLFLLDMKEALWVGLQMCNESDG
ncbi:hypothetical protein LZG74_19930 [Dyadobacter sp. CY327]|uniref:hypothetical protein n=1 Tax=Dyadobacter sp. CY327 TaxID=2907301 RepID=UPI001F41D184|nr:hypothetical protein [Dyadobacter sp. CY327]MCE7072593.1 hypothetical protein [Dyadobacter sp. CY327]